MLQKIKKNWEKAHDIIARYPMVLTVSLITALSAALYTYLSDKYYGANDSYHNLEMLLIVGSLGISLMFAVAMMVQRFGKEILLQLVVLAVLIGLYFYLPAHPKDFTPVYGYIIALLFLSSHLLVAFGAYINRGGEGDFWQFNKNLFINTFLTILFTGVLTGGVLLALTAIENLFDFNIPGYFYELLFAFLSIFGSTFIFLLFSDRGLPYLEKKSSYPEVLKFFTQFVLIPLLIIYLVILYFYSVKILINWELPRGWVSYLVLAYSVVGIFALLLVHPLKEQVSKSWVKIFSKLFYYTLLPLLVLLFVAIFTRILQYGYTEPRYFVLMIALWLSSVVLYFIFVKRATIKFIPISMFCFTMAAMLLPYFNAFAVSKRSQKHEFAKILENKNLLKNSKIDFSKSITHKDIAAIESKITFLIERKEQDFVLSFLDQEKKQKTSQIMLNESPWAASFQITQNFTNIPQDKHVESGHKRMELVSTKSIIPTEGYVFVTKFYSSAEESSSIFRTIKINDDKITFYNKLNDVKPSFIIALNNAEKKDILPDMEKWFKNYNTRERQNSVDELSTTVTLGKYKVTLYFDNIVKEQFTVPRYFFKDAIILIK